jgi:peptidoglycan/LPS O-acetylase OafA/YrhL
MGFDTRLDAVLIGGLLAVLGTSRVPRAVRRWWPIPVCVFALLWFVSSWRGSWLGYGGFTIAALLSVWLIAEAVNGGGRLGRVLEWRAVQWVGARSYSLYLWQVPLIGVVGLLPIPQPYPPIVILLSALLVADLSWRVFERPFMQPRFDGLPDRRKTRSG